MVPFSKIGEIYDAIQRVKAEAPAYCTNFFPVQQKLERLMGEGRLYGEVRDGTVFFFRKEGDFWRLYFCAASVASLQCEMMSLSSLKAERLVVDLIGKEPGLDDLQRAFAVVGFGEYGRLQRMARLNYTGLPKKSCCDVGVTWADISDGGALLDLLHASFNPYIDQLPEAGEIESAIRKEQILTVRHNSRPAAMLFFETQGLTSTIRYWVVSKEFRSCGYGSALMHQYLADHSATRRFTLWVGSRNENAIRSYEHYGYVPDGLVDLVLTNERIRL